MTQRSCICYKRVPTILYSLPQRTPTYLFLDVPQLMFTASNDSINNSQCGYKKAKSKNKFSISVSGTGLEEYFAPKMYLSLPLRQSNLHSIQMSRAKQSHQRQDINQYIIYLYHRATILNLKMSGLQHENCFHNLGEALVHT